MPDLLLEVLSEEIPARMQAGGSDALKDQVTRRLNDARLAFDADEVKSYATPRRLALIVPGLPAEQPDITVERKGPRVDAPEKAIQGFLKSTGLTRDECEERETPKGLVLFAVKLEKGRPTGDLLADLLPEALAAVSWPKSMRWEESGTRWVRPIRSILCLLDDQVVPFRFGPVESGRTTLGHRFLSSGPLTIERVDDYATTLKDAKVMLDPARRERKIREDAASLANREGLSIAQDEGLVEENAGLVEWPVVLMGRFDKRFMDLPEEVLRSAMRTHQRYFAVTGGILLAPPRFVMVSNTETSDDGAAIIAGNERVLRARLADARFFWEQDRRRRLEENLPALESVAFHACLGSMREKAQRIERLARSLFVAIQDVNPYWAPDGDPDEVARAGLLCKADLVSQMVGEFPDLQGTMGNYYAQGDGETTAVCKAINEHYAPQGPIDPCPWMAVSVAVALADKLDTLAGFFAIDERPTGSKDPFALRRAALGAIRLLIENDLRLPLDNAFAQAFDNYGMLLPDEPGPVAAKEALLDFFADRVKVYFRDHGLRYDLVSAVFAVGDEDDLERLWVRVEALDRFLTTDDGANLLTAYRRANNILQIEEKKDDARYEEKPDVLLFNQEEERTLHKHISEASNRAEFGLTHDDFEYATVVMASLRAPVDAFFDNVTVNCDDPALRHNRLLMLSQIRATLDRVADFSKIEG